MLWGNLSNHNLADTLLSFLSGLGVPGRDKAVSTSFIFVPIPPNELESAYRSDWIARKVVDIPAKDSTRAWRSWQAENPEIEKLEEVEKALLVQRKVRQALILSRLYGGSALIMGVENGKSNEELDIESVGQDDLKFLHVLPRQSLGTGGIIRDITSPYFGEPEYYTISTTPTVANPGETPPLENQIHPSRVVRFLGNPIPDASSVYSGSNNGWGDSVLQAVFDAIKAAGSVAQSGATLANEAKFDIVKIPELSKNIASRAYQDRLTSRFAFANSAKSIINTLLLDKEEDWERINTNFAYIPDLVRVYLLIVSGAADIPATRFLGQSPAGLSSTGESDIRNYYDHIADVQANEIQPALSRLDEVLIRSALGVRDPSTFYNWNPLWQMDDAQAADVGFKKAQIFQVDVNTGLIDPEALRIGRQNQLIEDGVYPGLEQALEEQDTLSMESMVSPEESLQAAQQVIQSAQAQVASQPAQQSQQQAA